MNTKRILTIGCVLASSVLIALGGFWQPAAANSGIVRLEKGQTIGLGAQGLHVTNIPDGVTHVYLDTVGTHLPSRFSHKTDIQYRAPAMEVRFLDARGGQVARISALVYVYFIIGRADRDLWLESGMDRIAIWFADEQTGSWNLCPTFFVDQSNGFRTGGRLACLAPGSGYYVLGQSDSGTSLPKSQTVDGENAATSTPDLATLNGRAYGGPYSADSHTLLLLHLDGSYDGAQGEVGTAIGTEFTAGRFGQGVLVDGNDTLSYPTAGNINADQGAVEFWLRPNWDGDAGGNYTLFRWGDGPDYIHLRKDPISNLVFDRFYAEGSCGAPMNVADWQAGEWHHIAITWQGVEISLYVDGRQVAQTTCSGSPEPVAENFYIGSGSRGEELPVDAVIDELRISDVPRVGNPESGSTPRPTALKVRAYVDGRSQLIIQGNTVYWHHLDFAAPGRHYDAEASQPTYLNHVAWEPIWPDVPDSENRDCNCDSSSYEAIPNLAKTNQLVWLDVVQGRGAVYIIQQPNAVNNYTLIVEFDDNPLDGPAWYEIALGY